MYSFRRLLTRIYGFIGAVPNLLSRAQSYFKLKLISLDKNYRFASNENMLQLDKIIRQNAVTPFQNPSALSSKVEFNIYEDQVKEALEVVIKSQEIQRQYPTSKVAILAKQRGPNIEHIIKTFDHNKISFFMDYLLMMIQSICNSIGNVFMNSLSSSR